MTDNKKANGSTILKNYLALKNEKKNSSTNSQHCMLLCPQSVIILPLLEKQSNCQYKDNPIFFDNYHFFFH